MSSDHGEIVRASTWTHEYVHKISGHHGLPDGPVSSARELAVERITALVKISFPLLLAAYPYFGDADEMVRIMRCDIGIIKARIFGLTALEQQILEICGRNCLFKVDVDAAA